MGAVLQRSWLVCALTVAGLLASWQAAGAAGWLPDYILDPVAIGRAAVDTTRDGLLLPAVGISVQRAAAGFVLGVTAGVTVGLVAGVLRSAEDVADTIVSVTYPLPKIALFPVVVIWLGYSDSARILVIAISCFYPAFINALAGARSIEPKLLWVARNMGAGRVGTFRDVVLRAAMPSVMSGLRISLALSLILTYATETLGAGRDGLGYLIQDGYNNLLYPVMWAGIASFAVLGFAADRLLVAASGRVLRGQRIEAAGHG